VGLLGDILQWLTDTAHGVLASTGYLGLFLLMAAESMVLPVPSEAVMPFAGILVAEGKMTWVGAIAASSAGSLFGSWLGYLMGQYGVANLVRRYGKYILVREHHLDAAHRWFEKRGAMAIFVCRFVPAVRHVISIPAGSARMPLGPFFLATFLGATAWNVILLWLGYEFGLAAMEAMKPYLDGVALVVFALVVAYLVWDWRKGKKAKAAALKAIASEPVVVVEPPAKGG
jgi:membrane protein DedA with SNARE-associated domain